MQEIQEYIHINSLLVQVCSPQMMLCESASAYKLKLEKVKNTYIMSTNWYRKFRIIGFAVRLAGILLLIFCLGFTLPLKQQTNDNEKVIPLEVKTDSTSFMLSQVLDSGGKTLYFYRDIDQFPCDDSVCQRMQVRIYWNVNGKYMKLTTPEGFGLTKINHKPFTARDYQKLDELLGNPKSYLRYYKLESLTNKAAEKHYYSVDAISGATVTEVTYETVRGAVKTCFVLWKIANGETPKYIRQLSKK